MAELNETRLQRDQQGRVIAIHLETEKKLEDQIREQMKTISAMEEEMETRQEEFEDRLRTSNQETSTSLEVNSSLSCVIFY